MSRTGKKPIAPSGGVTVTVNGRTVTAKGPKGELADAHGYRERQAGRWRDRHRARRHQASPLHAWGMSRTLIANMVDGVTKGFEKKLEIQGVGYRAAMQGKDLQARARLQPRRDLYPIPEGITITTPKPTEITVSGIDKQQVGQVAAEIRDYRRRSPTRARACVCRRVHLPQGRQEEVRSAQMAIKLKGAERARRAFARRSPRAPGRPRLSVFRSTRTSMPRSSTTRRA
jgi:large subunit ribosomal protein L6